HYAPQPCAPYRGNEKGKVERMIQYLRHSCFAARRFRSLDDLNGQLAHWIRDVAHTRALPGHQRDRLVRDALVEEQPRLLPLPPPPSRRALLCSSASRNPRPGPCDATPSPPPPPRVRRPRPLGARERAARVPAGGTGAPPPARRYDRGQRIEDPGHLAALAR